MDSTRKKHHLLADAHYAPSLDPGSDDEVYDADFEELIEKILVRLGDNPQREGLRRTPLRVAKAMDLLTS